MVIHFVQRERKRGDSSLHTYGIIIIIIIIIKMRRRSRRSRMMADGSFSETRLNDYYQKKWSRSKDSLSFSLTPHCTLHTLYSFVRPSVYLHSTPLHSTRLHCLNRHTHKHSFIYTMTFYIHLNWIELNWININKRKKNDEKIMRKSMQNKREREEKWTHFACV